MANKIQNNNTSLEQILATINALPNAGSGGGVDLPELSNPGGADDLVVGKQLIDGDGGVVTGTNPYEKTSTDAEINEQADLLQQITTTLAGKTAISPTLQSKTVTPTTSSQNVTPDSGYDGLSQVIVNAMPTATQATPSISVSSAGLITASATQSAGYVAAGTKSATKQLTTQAAQTITPGTSNKTIASGRYLTGTQTIKGDANLKAANIAKGVSIFNVTGTHEGGGGGSVETCTVTVKPVGSAVTDLCYTSVDENGKLITIFAGVVSPAGNEFICACGSMIVFSMSAYVSMTTENAEKIAESGSGVNVLVVKITASAGGTASIRPMADMGTS